MVTEKAQLARLVKQKPLGRQTFAAHPTRPTICDWLLSTLHYISRLNVVFWPKKMKTIKPCVYFFFWDHMPAHLNTMHTKSQQWLFVLLNCEIIVRLSSTFATGIFYWLCVQCSCQGSQQKYCPCGRHAGCWGYSTSPHLQWRAAAWARDGCAHGNQNGDLWGSITTETRHCLQQTRALPINV